MPARMTLRPSLIWSLVGIAVGAGLTAAILLLGDVPARNAPPNELADQLEFPGIPDAWMWGDAIPDIVDRWRDATDEEMIQKYAGVYGVPHNYLAISGGADNGAYAAGVLCGWTDSGTRPVFTLVTGISTGALAAPFVFLGSEYDEQLREIYTTYNTDDLIDGRNPLAAVTSDAFASTAPLKALIRQYITEDVLDAIATEYRKGRILLIGTTNLDANRPVLWRIGRIATSDSPRRLELVQDVLLASASIPVAFPPVYIPARGPDGTLYDELHVDGSVTSQLFVYPIGIDWSEVLDKMDVPGTPNLYVIRNDKLEPEWRAVDPGSALNIGRRTIESVIRTHAIGDLFRLYLGSVRDGLQFHLASIPAGFTAESQELFDPAYMGDLFEAGYRQAIQGDLWSLLPPGYRR